jgi:hypothetical protein
MFNKTAILSSFVEVSLSIKRSIFAKLFHHFHHALSAHTLAPTGATAAYMPLEMGSGIGSGIWLWLPLLL